MLAKIAAITLGMMTMLHGVNDTTVTQGQTPRLMMETATVSQEYVTPGEKAEVSITLRNTHESKNLRNIRLSLTDDAGELLARDGAQLWPALAAGEGETVTFDIEAIPTARDGVHPMTLSLEYEDTKSIPYASQETVYVTVRQAVRMEYSEPRFPQVTVQGDNPVLTMSLMNMGKGELYNALVTLELPGLSNGGSVMAGNLAAGESRDVQMTLTTGFDVLGETKGEVILTWEDAYGQGYERRIPIATQIEEKVVLTPPVEEEEDEFPWKKLAIALGALSGVLLVTASVAWIRTLKRERRELAKL